MPTYFFCDTSIIYYRLVYPSRVRDYVDRVTRGATRGITHFVRGEFLRGYIETLLELYFALDAAPSVQDAIDSFLDDCAFRPRQQQNALRSVTAWLTTECDDAVNAEKSKQRLAQYIKRVLIDLDDLFPNRELDPMRCEIGVIGLAAEEFRESQLLDLYDQIQRVVEKPECQQCEFRGSTIANTSANGIDLTSAAQVVKFQDYEGFAKQVRHMRRAVKSKLKKRSCRYCSALGDTVIALTAPKNATILTVDKSSFPALGEILGKDVRIINKKDIQ